MLNPKVEEVVVPRSYRLVTVKDYYRVLPVGVIPEISRDSDIFEVSTANKSSQMFPTVIRRIGEPRHAQMGSTFPFNTAQLTVQHH